MAGSGRPQAVSCRIFATNRPGDLRILQGCNPVSGSEWCSSPHKRLGGFSRTASWVISQVACVLRPPAADPGNRDLPGDELRKPTPKYATAGVMGQHHNVTRWRRVASIRRNSASVICFGSTAITVDTCGPLTIHRVGSGTRFLGDRCHNCGSARLRTRHLPSWLQLSPVVSMSYGVLRLAHRLQ